MFFIVTCRIKNLLSSPLGLNDKKPLLSLTLDAEVLSFTVSSIFLVFTISPILNFSIFLVLLQKSINFLKINQNDVNHYLQ
mgnify:CR=1 FL=1